MKFPHRAITAAAVTAAAFASPNARALVALEDGRDHVFVDGSVEMGYDSNVFANAQSGGSFETQGSLVTEFTRRAGWIGVDMTAGVTFEDFASDPSQNFVDPKLTAELTKQSGRTTGSLTFSVQKENRADVDVNTRDVSWNYDVGLNFQYPVIERYTISGSFAFDHVDYQDQVLFTNQTSYTGNLYLYYILNEQRDLFVNYTSRLTDEANGEHYVDNGLSLGVSGRVVGPFNGSLQFGYEQRTPYGVGAGGAYDDLSSSGSVTWNINRRTGLTAYVSRDFSTTANAISVEGTNGGLTLQDSFTARAVGTLDASVGENDFLGEAGLVAPGGDRRVDQHAAFDAFYSYAFNQHLKVQVGYSYYRSWSTLAYAQFTRSQVHLTLSSHW